MLVVTLDKDAISPVVFWDKDVEYRGLLQYLAAKAVSGNTAGVARVGVW